MIFSKESKRLISVLVMLSMMGATTELWAQCLEEGEVMLPESLESRSDNYGVNTASYDNYLAVTATGNDILEFDGGLVYLYKYDSENWSKVAELSASEYNLQMFLGRKVALSDNILVIAGNTFSPEGLHYDELFIYTKISGEEWSNSTESYRVILGDELSSASVIVNEIVIHNEYLGVSYTSASEYKVVFYRINADNSLTEVRKIDSPTYSNGEPIPFGTSFDFSNSTLAIGSRAFRNEQNGQNGAIFVYDWNDILSPGVLEPIILSAENPKHQDFPYELKVDGQTIYAIDGYSYDIVGEYPSNILVFEKPNAGWEDMHETAILTTSSKEYASSYHTLRVSGDYAFISRSFLDNGIYGFKKPLLGWEDAVSNINITKEPENDQDYRAFGYSFEMFDDQIVISYIGGNSHLNRNNREVIICYNAPDGRFESTLTEDQRLSEVYNSATDARFGYSLSYSNDRLAVGSIGDRNNGLFTGAVYLYDRDLATEDYELSSIIRPEEGRPYDNFGYSVELSDSLLFVSSIFYDSMNADGSYFNGSIGRVYYYKLEDNDWNLKSIIYSPDDLSDKNNKYFGQSISYYNGNLAISQYYTGSSESNGKVHIYKLQEGDKWEAIAEMKTEEQQGGDFFGRKIMLKDSLLVVATGHAEHSPDDEMRVYLFNRKGNNDWESSTEDGYLISSDKQRYDRFGFSIDMHRDMIVVGAPGFRYVDNEYFAGKAYVFNMPIEGWRGTIEETVALEPKENMAENFFGYDIFIDDNQILVGAASSINNPSSAWFTADIPDLQPGKLYFFDPYSHRDLNLEMRNERYIQLSPNNRYLDGFGFEIEKSYDRVFVSALYDNNESGYKAGGVYDLKFTTYIYSVEEPICIDANPFLMKSNRLGGVWSGEGIIDATSGLFDPSLVNEEGWTLVTYKAGDCEVTSSLNLGSSPKLISHSDSEVIKCFDDKVELSISYTSNVRAYPKWYFKENISDIPQLIESNVDTIQVDLSGYYSVEVDNGFCTTLNIDFEVQIENLDIALNKNDYVEVCSYSNENLFLIPDDNLNNITWHFRETGSSEYSASGNSKQMVLDRSGFYFATYETSLCTYSSDTVEVYYNHLELQLETPEIICSPDPYQLNANSTGGYWSGVGLSEDGLIEVGDLGSGEFSAQYNMVAGGCLFSETIDYETLLLPEPNIDIIDPRTCPDQPIELSIDNNYFDARVQWFKTDKENVISSDELFSTDKPGNYFAKFDLKGCESTSETVLLIPKNDSLFVPNVITNNNDGLNDDFRFYAEGANYLELAIVNRWGKQIYFDDSQLIWRPDENQSPGIYYWHITYANCYDEPQSITGWVHLMND